MSESTIDGDADPDGGRPAWPAWPEETIPILRVADAGAALRWYEVSLVDPDGNRIRLGALTGRSEPGYTVPGTEAT